MSSWPILELYPSIFLHKHFFAYCTITPIIQSSYFIVFPPILLGMYSYTFIPNFFWASFIEVYCYTFLMLPIFRTGLIHCCHPNPFETVNFHFSTQAHFWKCTIPPIILISHFIVFPPILLGMYSYTFIPNLFLTSFIEVYCYTFLLLPIFRTGLIHFCHPRPFWNCILPFFYPSPFLELYYYTYHYIFSFHHFPADTFRNVLLHFLSPTFFGPVS